MEASRRYLLTEGAVSSPKVALPNPWTPTLADTPDGEGEQVIERLLEMRYLDRVPADPEVAKLCSLRSTAIWPALSFASLATLREFWP